jgi:hypothetical protein
MVYSSPEECHHLFSKGSGNGGIAAAFDELAYIKIILSRYCSKYTVIDPKFKTGGFGFVSSLCYLVISFYSVANKCIVSHVSFLFLTSGLP